MISLSQLHFLCNCNFLFKLIKKTTWTVLEVPASRIEKNFATIFLAYYILARFVHGFRFLTGWMRFLFVLVTCSLHRRSAVSRHENRRYIRGSIVISFSETRPAGYVHECGLQICNSARTWWTSPDARRYEKLHTCYVPICVTRNIMWILKRKTRTL